MVEHTIYETALYGFLRSLCYFPSFRSMAFLTNKSSVCVCVCVREREVWQYEYLVYTRCLLSQYDSMCVFVRQISLSDARNVTLLNVQRQLTGFYKCEVSADAPLFHTEIKSASMTVVGK